MKLSPAIVFDYRRKMNHRAFLITMRLILIKLANSFFY